MSAQLVPDDMDSVEENLPQETFEQPEDSIAAPEVPEQPVPEPENKIPKHLQGLSVEELADKYANLEKEKSRIGNEVGELRKLADELILRQAKPEPKKVEDVDFFENPKAAVESVIANNPELQEARMAAVQLKQERAKLALKTKHPDYEGILQDENFMEWVKGSKIRQELINRAHRAFDTDAADELFSSWKERAGRTKEVVDENNQRLSEQMKAAKLTTGGSGEAPKKIYRRVDIMNLMTRDPDKYEAMQDEIMRAYSEGRVK